MQGAFFRGTTHSQDGRFSDKEKKLMQVMKFDEILETKIDLKKVDLCVFEPWVEEQVNNILKMEDEVIPAMIINELETYKTEEKAPNGKLIQIRITGFLERDAKKFMVNLWKLLIEAQESPHGIPVSLIQAKKNELKDKEEQLKKIDEQRRRLEEVQQKLKEDEIKLKQVKRLFTDVSEEESVVSFKNNQSEREVHSTPNDHKRRNSRSRSRDNKKKGGNSQKESHSKDKSHKDLKKKEKKQRSSNKRRHASRSRSRSEQSKSSNSSQNARRERKNHKNRK